MPFRSVQRNWVIKIDRVALKKSNSLFLKILIHYPSEIFFSKSVEFLVLLLYNKGMVKELTKYIIGGIYMRKIIIIVMAYAKKKCKKCNKEFTPTCTNQNYCPDCLGE